MSTPGEHWTPEFCTQQLRDAARELGRTPTYEWWLRNRDTPSVRYLRFRYGSGTWTSVTRRAGLTPNTLHTPRRPGFTFADLLDALHTETRRLGRPPTIPEWHARHAIEPALPSVHQLTYRFGSWHAVTNAAGLPAATDHHL
jgi:hypothetical protein